LVLSLAFILALIGSAVALLLGILIFSEVSEAMALVLPTVGVNEVDGEWFAREHCAVSGCLSNSNENRMEFSTSSSAFIITGFGATTQTTGYVGKVFTFEQLNNKLITISWQQSASQNREMRVLIFNGTLDPTLTGACGSNCFPDESSIPLSSTVVVANTFGIQPQKFDSGTVDLSTINFNSPQLTLVVESRDNSPNVIQNRMFSLEIAGLGLWDFSTTVFTFIFGDDNSSSLNVLPQVNIYGTYSSDPPFVNDDTADEIQQVEAFNQANNIAFTVIGILPVALFFFLFTIFSGRAE